jgi:hypothetical protein
LGTEKNNTSSGKNDCKNKGTDLISGFEKQTKDLSYEEIKLAHKIAEAFRARGKDVPITSTLIIKKMTQKGYSINGGRLRKMIRYIRVKNILDWIIADGTSGYVYTKDLQKVQKYLKSLQDREGAIRETRLSFNNIYV